MNREEILAAAQKNNQRGREYEERQVLRGDLLASAMSLFLGLFLFLIEFLARQTVNFGLIAVGTCASGVQALYEGIKLRKKSRVLLGVFQLAVCLISVLLFIGKVVLQ